MATILEVPSATTNETIPVDLDEVFLSDSPEQLHDVVHLLRNENAAGHLWTALIEACLARGRTRTALDMVDEALRTLPDPRDHVAPLCLKANVHLALARKAPKCEPEHLMAGQIAPPKDPHHPEFASHNKVFLKQEYWMRAAKDLENAHRIDPNSRVVRDLQAALAMAQGQLDRASKLWEMILADEPTHLVALMGKARSPPIVSPWLFWPQLTSSTPACPPAGPLPVLATRVPSRTQDVPARAPTLAPVLARPPHRDRSLLLDAPRSRKGKEGVGAVHGRRKFVPALLGSRSYAS